MHGSALRTDDLDLCFERTPANYKKIMHAIRAFHPRPRGVPGDLNAPFDEHSLAQGANFTLTTDAGNLDLMGELSGVGGYKDISGTASGMNFGAITCRVASLETLIRSKEAANRPKDQAALPELRALKTIKEAKP